jgi:hypothetical protein
MLGVKVWNCVFFWRVFKQVIPKLSASCLSLKVRREIRSRMIWVLIRLRNDTIVVQYITYIYIYIHSYMFRSYDHHQVEKPIKTHIIRYHKRNRMQTPQTKKLEVFIIVICVRNIGLGRDNDLRNQQYYSCEIIVPLVIWTIILSTRTSYANHHGTKCKLFYEISYFYEY